MKVTTELLSDVAKMITDGRSRKLSTCPPSEPNLLCVGKVKHVIDSVYKFDDVLSAYDRILTGHARGKVVVEIA